MNYNLDLFTSSSMHKVEPLGVPYMGSKRKYATDLINQILLIKPDAKYFVDLFGGGGAMSFAALQKGMIVHYNEKQTDMADFMRFIFECIRSPQSKFGIFPAEYYHFITREKFMELRTQSGVYAQFARICYSFGNNQKSYMFNPELEVLKHLLHDVVVFSDLDSLEKFNGIFKSRIVLSEKKTWNDRRLDIGSQIKKADKRIDLERLQQLEQLEQLERLQQLQQLERFIAITNLDYGDVKIETPVNETIVYLDPPYRGTAKYIKGVDYEKLDKFFNDLPFLAFMSEYNAPFKSIYEIHTRSTLSPTSNNCKKIEKLFINKQETLL